MNSYYAEHDVFIESVRRFVDAELRPHLDDWEKAGDFPDQVFPTIGEQGFLGILIPEEYGGIGGDYHMAGAWCETFGELPCVGLTIGVNMHSLVISHALAQFGSEASKQRWLPKAASGEAIGAYAFTEPGAGSDLANLRTKAERSGDKWLLNGAKTFITNGDRADFVLVLARHDFDKGYEGFTTFAVDTKLPGFQVNRRLDKLGWHASDTVELTLENVEVDQDCILGDVGQGWIQASKNLNWERLMLTLTSLAGARACMRDTVRYAKERQAFGKAIIELDAVRSALIEMQRRIESAEAMCHHSLDLIQAGDDCRETVSLTKRIACEDAIWIADRAIQLHGGYGYTTEFSAERWWRDLRLMTIGGGTSEIMANVALKQLGA